MALQQQALTGLINPERENILWEHIWETLRKQLTERKGKVTLNTLLKVAFHAGVHHDEQEAMVLGALAVSIIAMIRHEFS